RIKLVLSIHHIPFLPAFLCKVTTEEEFAVLEGGSLTIPCHYEPQYASYVKYWCQGRTREFCTSLARTDDHHLVDPAEKKVSIFDDPVQLVFTVTMTDMKEGESGWYICGVEIGGVWEADDVAYTDVKVVHGMSAVNSRMSGAEGSAVTIECLYSERYRHLTFSPLTKKASFLLCSSMENLIDVLKIFSVQTSTDHCITQQ
uniref:Polymeric immunoglobulin receptor n=1 Tax=Xiphophorus couchianus TaxID=32473 RepID=A0A3B5LDQ7_9TELE